MSKKSEIGNEVANNMNELLVNENFTKIFHKTAHSDVQQLANQYISEIKAIRSTSSIGNYAIEVLNRILNNMPLDNNMVNLAISDLDEFPFGDYNVENIKIFIKQNSKIENDKDATNMAAIAGYNSFEKFVTLAKKKDKDEDSEKEDKDSNKKEDKKKDKKDDSDKDDKKSKKKGKKPFPFWLKKKKASDKCGCSADCSCKEGKSCSCEGCKDCAACGDMMYSSAIKYMVETLTRTSAALDNMGLEKSSIATMVALNHIIEEAAQDKFASDESSLDENDVRGMDLLLGLEDDEAKEGFGDEELDDPHSSAALEDILTKNPNLADDLSTNLKGKFDVEDQLKNRIKSRLDQVVHTKDDDSDIEELAANKLPDLKDDLVKKLPPVNDFMKEKQNDDLLGDETIRAPNNDFTGDNVRLDQLNVDDPEVVKAFKELDNWVKSAETNVETVDDEDLDNMIESYINGQ